MRLPAQMLCRDIELKCYRPVIPPGHDMRTLRYTSSSHTGRIHDSLIVEDMRICDTLRSVPKIV